MPITIHECMCFLVHDHDTALESTHRTGLTVLCKLTLGGVRHRSFAIDAEFSHDEGFSMPSSSDRGEDGEGTMIYKPDACAIPTA